MNNILSQVFGILVFVFVFASMQTKNIKSVLLCQIIINGLGMLSYVLIGGFSGCGIYLVATAQSVIYYVIRRTGREEPRWLKPVILAAYLLCSVVAFKEALDVVPMAAAVLCALGISQQKPSKYRILILLNGAVWMIYDIFIGAYGMLASHAVTVVSALSGIIRFDIMKKEEK